MRPRPFHGSGRDESARPRLYAAAVTHWQNACSPYQAWSFQLRSVSVYVGCVEVSDGVSLTNA